MGEWASGARERVVTVSAIIGAWAAALVYSGAAGRVMYGDGAWLVLWHLATPYRFHDIDFQRSFALYISQAPILFGQRAGLENVSAYVLLYWFGALVIPALAMMAALFLARRQPLLFAANVAAIAVYGFGTNFINTEANLLYGLAWLAATILALDRPAPVLRGVVLPVAAFALLRTYEGMLLVGPVLALWALFAWERASHPGERLGLATAGFLFLLGAVIGLGGFLAPRDPGNAAGFFASAFRYLVNPHVWLMLSAFAALAGAMSTGRVRAAWAVVSAALGIAYVAGIVRIEGFYGFDVYYLNRAFMALALPAFLAALLVVWRWRSPWLAARGAGEGYAVLAIPIAFAVAGDMVGTRRWSDYVGEFCKVLRQDGTPVERLGALKGSGVRTAWPWSHPSMSVLLRDRGSPAVVANEPGQFTWQPFEPAKPPAIDYRGFCQAGPFTRPAPDSYDRAMVFSGAKLPSYVARVRGLSGSEGWGTWSEGPRVDIDFAQPLPRSFDLAIRVGPVFGPNKGQPIRVSAGGKEQAFVAQEPFEGLLQFRDVGAASTLSFAIPQPSSPLELGTGADARKLGIGLVSLRVIPR